MLKIKKYKVNNRNIKDSHAPQHTYFKSLRNPWLVGKLWWGRYSQLLHSSRKRLPIRAYKMSPCE